MNWLISFLTTVTSIGGILFYTRRNKEAIRKKYKQYRKYFHLLTKFLRPTPYVLPKQTAEDFPLPYFPTTWYPIGFANEFKPNQIYHRKIAGQDIVVYRNSLCSERIHVQYRHCPHMGVDLQYGTIMNDCIICPFHHHCIHPSKPNTVINEKPKEEIPVEQAGGVIFVWFGSSSPSISIQTMYASYFEEEHKVNDPQLYSWPMLSRTVGGHLVDYAEHLLDVSHAPNTHGVTLYEVNNMLTTTDHSFIVQFGIHGYGKIPKFTYMTPTFGYIDYGYNMKTFVMFVVEDVGKMRMVIVPLYYKSGTYLQSVYSLFGALYTQFDFSEEAAFFSTKKHKNRSLTKNEKNMEEFRKWFGKTYYSEKSMHHFYNKQW